MCAMMTWQELLKEGTKQLSAAQVEDAAVDARALLFYVAGFDLHHYALSMNERVDEDAVKRYRSVILRRERHEPLQYITGEAYFYGRSFFVQSGVLIPRFDTEVLIEAVLPYLRKGQRILDVCTGSGCILLTLLLEAGNDMEAVGVDISDQALFVARENAKRLLGADRKISFLKSDLFCEVEGNFDVIVSNPPYIQTAVIPTLSSEVRDFEPHLALDGEADGLAFYRRITSQAMPHLKASGVLAFEIGFDQGEAVSDLMKEGGFAEVRCIQDLSGLDRVVIGVKPC